MLKKRNAFKILAIAIALLLSAGCVGKTDNKTTAAETQSASLTGIEQGMGEGEEAKEGTKEKTKAEIKAETNAETKTEGEIPIKNKEGMDEREEDMRSEFVSGNFSHFVEYREKIWYLSPKEDRMQAAAIWGKYDYVTEGQGSRVAAYDPKTNQTEFPFEGRYNGKIAVSGNRLILNGTDEEEKAFVHSVKLDGSDIQVLPGEWILGTKEDGEYFVTGGYDEENVLRAYICKSDGTWKEAEFKNRIFEYAGMSDEHAFFITIDEGGIGRLVSYRLETGETMGYGIIPEFEESISGNGIGTPRELYTENGSVYLHMAAYEGSAAMYADSKFMMAKLDQENSIEIIHPKSDEGFVRMPEETPVVILVDGNMILTNGIPGTAGVNQNGVAGFFDESGHFVRVAHGFDEKWIEKEQTRMNTEIYEKRGKSIYLIRNLEERAPEEDIGWREAYRRLERTLYRIDIKNGGIHKIEHIQNSISAR